jgi:small membrane protein
MDTKFSLIQAVLFAGAVGFLFYALRSASHLRQRIIGMLLFVLIGIAVIFPRSTTTLAEFLGVGRGTDLVFYLSFFLFLYISVTLLARANRLERKVTQLARAVALIQGDSNSTPETDKHE